MMFDYVRGFLNGLFTVLKSAVPLMLTWLASREHAAKKQAEANARAAEKEAEHAAKAKDFYADPDDIADDILLRRSERDVPGSGGNHPQ